MRLSAKALACLVVAVVCAVLTLMSSPVPEWDRTIVLLALVSLLLEARAVPGTRYGPFSCASTFYLAATLTPAVGPPGALLCCVLGLVIRALIGPQPRLSETYIADFGPVATAALAATYLSKQTPVSFFLTAGVFFACSEIFSRTLYPLQKPTRLTRTRFALASILGAIPVLYLATNEPMLTVFMGALMLIVQNGSYMQIRQEALTETARSLVNTKKDLANARRETNVTSHRLERTAKERDLVENLAKYFARNPSESQVLKSCLQAVQPLFPGSESSLWRWTGQDFQPWLPSEPSFAPAEKWLQKCWQFQKVQWFEEGGRVYILAPLPEIGILLLRTSGSDEPSQQRLDLLTILTSQFALGLQSARFRGELQQALQLQTETNRKLQESQAQLVQSGKMAAVGQLAAGVAHELNSPLAAALLQVQMGKMRLQSESYEKLGKSLETAELSINIAQEIIDKLLGFSRASQGSRELLNISAVIQASWDLVREQFEFQSIKTELKLAEGLWVRGASTELQQVFVNLLLNARYAVLQTAEERPPRIYIEAFAHADRVAVVVSDSGPGVPEEIAARVFEPFFTTKSVGEGTGLGLSISFEILKAHEGTIELKSSSSGASFRVLLPLRNPE